MGAGRNAKASRESKIIKKNRKKCQKLSFRGRCLLHSALWRTLRRYYIIPGVSGATLQLRWSRLMAMAAYTLTYGITQCQLIYNAYHCGGAWLYLLQLSLLLRARADLYCTKSWQQTLLMHMYAREQQQYARAAVQHLDARHLTQRIDPHDSFVVVGVAENELQQQQQLRCCFAGGGSNDNNSGSSERLRGGGDPVVAVTCLLVLLRTAILSQNDGTRFSLAV
uniref:Uncharacterized protein n=1 Tax=Trichogramma kaykai TaxID=54128 RepID=A0ABD2VUG0_9HYME